MTISQLVLNSDTAFDDFLYDSLADVLYLGKPVCAISEDIGDGIIIRYLNNLIVGVTVLDYVERRSVALHQKLLSLLPGINFPVIDSQIT